MAYAQNYQEQTLKLQTSCATALTSVFQSTHKPVVSQYW